MTPRNLDRIRSAVLPFLVLATLLLVTAGISVCRAEAAGPELTVAPADLERLTGSYENKEMGFAFKLDLQESRLRLTITKGPAFPPALLIPTSPTEFRWEGEGLAPGLRVTFQVTGDKAASLTVLQPGLPVVVMRRVSV